MNQQAEQQFETSKNLKALGITTAVIGGLFLIFFLISWTIPLQTPPSAETGVEVNLGNSDFGSGNVAPQSPGEPSAAPETTPAPPPTARPGSCAGSGRRCAPRADNQSPDTGRWRTPACVCVCARSRACVVEHACVHGCCRGWWRTPARACACVWWSVRLRPAREW